MPSAIENTQAADYGGLLLCLVRFFPVRTTIDAGPAVHPGPSFALAPLFLFRPGIDPGPSVLARAPSDTRTSFIASHCRLRWLPRLTHETIVYIISGSYLRSDSEPSFDVDIHAVDKRPFVRVTFHDGKTEAIYGFATKADAIKWIRCEAIVWLYERRKPFEAKEAAN